MKKLIGIVLFLFFAMTIMFLAAESLGWMDREFVTAGLTSIRDSHGGPAVIALLIAGLLAADLFIPVPSSVLMTLSGYFCGWPAGAAVSFLGAMCSAVVGFALCRRFGSRAFRRIIGNDESDRVARMLERYGAWAIILSRSVPMLTEIMSCVAGLGNMRFRNFLALSAAGTLPVCVVYAWAGAECGDTQGMGWAVLIAFVIPAAGFALIRLFHRKDAERGK